MAKWLAHLEEMVHPEMLDWTKQDIAQIKNTKGLGLKRISFVCLRPAYLAPTPDLET